MSREDTKKDLCAAFQNRLARLTKAKNLLVPDPIDAAQLQAELNTALQEADTADDTKQDQWDVWARHDPNRPARNRQRLR